MYIIVPQFILIVTHSLCFVLYCTFYIVESWINNMYYNLFILFIIHSFIYSLKIKYTMILVQELYTNIDQTSVNSLHGLLNCEIGGLDCRVITSYNRV